MNTQPRPLDPAERGQIPRAPATEPLRLAADLADTGITANAVLPGSTETMLLSHSAEIYGIDDPARFADHHVDHRIIRPDEVAAVVAWLCSPASIALTGAVVPADAGMTAR